MPDIESTDEVVTTIRRLNAEAVIHRTQKCEIDLGLILNRGIFNPEQAKAKLDTTRQTADQWSEDNHLPELRSEDGMVPSKRAENPVSLHRHDRSIGTIRLELPGYLDLER